MQWVFPGWLLSAAPARARASRAGPFQVRLAGLQLHLQSLWIGEDLASGWKGAGHGARGIQVWLW